MDVALYEPGRRLLPREPREDRLRAWDGFPDGERIRAPLRKARRGRLRPAPRRGRGGRLGLRRDRRRARRRRPARRRPPVQVGPPGGRSGSPCGSRARPSSSRTSFSTRSPSAGSASARGHGGSSGSRSGGGALAEVELPGGGPRPAPPATRRRRATRSTRRSRPRPWPGKIAEQPWSGLFLAFDYGKSWEEIAFETPAGTARAYRGMSQRNDLLDRPGEQDLTCHVCWDWLEEALRGLGFGEPARRVPGGVLHPQRVPGSSRRSRHREAGRLSRDKLSLLQLLHPAHMGQKFQALWAARGNAGPPGAG